MKEADIGYAPADLESDELVARVKASRGSLWDVEAAPSHAAARNLPTQDLLVALHPKLHRKFFVRRGGLVVVTLATEGDGLGKVQGEITNIVADQREWERMPYFPKEFATKRETTTLDLPPAASDEEEYEY